MRGLAGKGILVTGGTGRLGSAISERLEQEGASVFLVDRTVSIHLKRAVAKVRKFATKPDAIIDGIKQMFLKRPQLKMHSVKQSMPLAKSKSW